MVPEERPDPVDPDIPHVPSFRGRHPLRILALIALGGVLGAAARHGISELVGDGEGEFPAATFAVNTIGAFVLGVLITIVAELPPRRAFRPFLATGLLGAFTTFSTFAVETVVLVDLGHLWLAASYVAATLVVGITAAWVGMVGARLALGPRIGAAR